MIFLTKEQIILLHEQLINRYGGIPGIRDEGLLDSALNAPLQGFGGYEFFPSIINKATRLCIGLVGNHPFYDGNKRIAALALLSTLDLNNIQLQATSQELSDIILKLAASEIDDETFLKWLIEKT